MSQAAPRDAAAPNETELQALVEAGRVEEARRRLAWLRQQGVDEPWVAAWGAALAPARVRVLASHGPEGTEESMAWLRAFGDQYRGLWVALRRGELLGSDASRVELHRDLARRGLLDEALFVWLDGEMKCICAPR
jgi:hypothetical protein